MSASFTLDSNVLTQLFAMQIMVGEKPTIREIMNQAFTEIGLDRASTGLIKQEAKEMVQWLHSTSGAAKKFNKHWAFYLGVARKAGLAWIRTGDEAMAWGIKQGDPFQCGQFIPLGCVESEIRVAEEMRDWSEYECKCCGEVCQRWM